MGNSSLRARSDVLPNAVDPVIPPGEILFSYRRNPTPTMLKEATGAALSRGGERVTDETIMARIAHVYPTLSQAHRLAADFVLKHPFQAATMMIDELARAAGISVATANRFARALGIDGYPAFRAQLARTFSATLAPVEKLRADLQRSADSAEIS